MSTQRNLLVGCGTIAALVLVLVVIGGIWVWHVAQDIEGMSVAIEVPLDVKTGDTFEVVVSITNERSDKNLTISDIDIGDGYLEGLVILGTDPLPVSSMHVPLVNCMSYTFDDTLAPGETKSYTFTMRAERAGIYRADLDVCEGQRLTTNLLQTVVRD